MHWMGESVVISSDSRCREVGEVCLIVRNPNRKKNSCRRPSTGFMISGRLLRPPERQTDHTQSSIHVFIRRNAWHQPANSHSSSSSYASVSSRQFTGTPFSISSSNSSAEREENEIQTHRLTHSIVCSWRREPEITRSWSERQGLRCSEKSE